MKIPFALSSVVLAASLLATVPADARPLQEPGSHLAIDVPDEWSVGTAGKYTRALSADNQFQLLVVPTGRAFTKGQEQVAEDHAMQFVREHVRDINITSHSHYVDWNNYVGYEIRGTGRTGASNAPSKFFAMVLVDAHNSNKGVVAIGLGSDAGFDKHNATIYNALHSLRAY